MTSYTRYINKGGESSSSFSNHNMAPGRSHKRLAPDASFSNPSDASNQASEDANKRQRQSNYSYIQRSRSYGVYPTPPRSAASLPPPQPPPILPKRSVRPTKLLNLKLEIPKHEPSAREKRQLAARKAAATKWVPKLQDPFPKASEISKAYNLKLMRHYPANNEPADQTQTLNQPSKSGQSSSTVAPSNADIIKPVIAKSARVTKLLKAFPALEIPAAPPKSDSEPLDMDKESYKLMVNRKNTSTGTAERLAWQSFARADYARRQVMVESALPQDEIAKEDKGIPNRLPEWKKWRTSKYCPEKKDGGASERGKGKGRRL